MKKLSVTLVVKITGCFVLTNNENEKVILCSVMDTYVKRVQVGES